MDISNLCRSCMREVASWERENFNPEAVDMFCYCTNVKVMDDEKLPRQFCYNCIIKIESSYTFIREAQNVNIKLKNLASRSETSIIIEPVSYKSVETEHEQNKLRLTLPDYKVSIRISNLNESNTFDDTEASLNQIEDTCLSNCPIQILPNETITQPKVNVNLNEKIINQVKKTTKIVGDPNKFICPSCKKSFVSKKWFTKHVEKEHSGQKYVCAHCPKSFSKAYQLAYHAKSHSEERKFVCNTCGKRFKHRKQLTIHSRGHSDIRPYACDQCSKRFKHKSVLKCHMTVHESVKQHLCSYCGWAFSQAGALKVHLHTHTGAKPHACTQCGFRSAAASSLRRHQRRHSGARKYVCTHCRKGFYDASGLARHTRTHTGELPYKCPGCTRSFADSWKRKTHLMRAHRLALADIPRMRTDGTCT